MRRPGKRSTPVVEAAARDDAVAERSADQEPAPGDLAPAPPGEEPAHACTSLHDVQGVTLDNLDAAIAEIAGTLSALHVAFEDRFRSDATKEDLFKRLYNELEELKAEQRMEGRKPLLLDLVLLVDRIERQIENAETGTSILGSIRDEVLDILQRQGVDRVDDVSSELDGRLRETLGQFEAENRGDDAQYRLVRAGYRLGLRVIRPQQVLSRVETSVG